MGRLLTILNRGGEAPLSGWVSVHNTNLRTGSTTILLPFNAATGGNRTIDWGDGVVEVINTANPSHTYATDGVYTVRASGGTTTSLGNAASANNDDGWRLTCTEVRSWNGMGFTSLQNAFRGHVPDVKVPSYAPAGLTNLNNTFREASAFNQPIGSWDVSQVTLFNGTFNRAIAFNQPIGNWNVSNATQMIEMFINATAFNQDISSWNVSSATNMTSMFQRFFLAGSNAFDQNIGPWELRTAGVNLTNMFAQSTGTLSLSTENYSRTLIGWANGIASRSGQPAVVTFGAGTRKYNATVYEPTLTYTNAVDARAYLVGLGWTITDGGLA